MNLTVKRLIFCLIRTVCVSMDVHLPACGIIICLSWSHLTEGRQIDTLINSMGIGKLGNLHFFALSVMSDYRRFGHDFWPNYHCILPPRKKEGTSSNGCSTRQSLGLCLWVVEAPPAFLQGLTWCTRVYHLNGAGGVVKAIVYRFLQYLHDYEYVSHAVLQWYCNCECEGGEERQPERKQMLLIQLPMHLHLQEQGKDQGDGLSET